MKWEDQARSERHQDVKIRRGRLSVRRGMALLAWVTCTGCASMNYADRGAALGGLTGAGVGATIGHATGHTGPGALIGSAVGVLTGAAVGSGMDSIRGENQAMYQQQQAAMNRMASLQDAAEMTRAGIADDVIVRHFQTRGLAAPPTTSDLIALKQQGVSDNVLRALQSIGPRTEMPAVAPVTYVEAAPPPQVIVEEHFYAEPIPVPMWGPRRACRPLPPHHHHGRGPGVHWGVSVSN